MLELSKVGCEDFASFSEEEERRAGHFGSSPLIRRGHMTHLPLKKQLDIQKQYMDFEICTVCTNQFSELQYYSVWHRFQSPYTACISTWER